MRIKHWVVCNRRDAEFTNETNLTKHKENVHEAEISNLKNPKEKNNYEYKTFLINNMETLHDADDYKKISPSIKPPTAIANKEDIATKCHSCDINFTNELSFSEHEKANHKVKGTNIDIIASDTPPKNQKYIDENMMDNRKNVNINPTFAEMNENKLNIKMKPTNIPEEQANDNYNHTSANIEEKEVKVTKDIMKIMTLNAIFSTSKENMIQDPTIVKFTIPTSYKSLWTAILLLKGVKFNVVEFHLFCGAYNFSNTKYAHFIVILLI